MDVLFRIAAGERAIAGPKKLKTAFAVAFDTKPIGTGLRAKSLKTT